MHNTMTLVLYAIIAIGCMIGAYFALASGRKLLIYKTWLGMLLVFVGAAALLVGMMLFGIVGQNLLQVFATHCQSCDATVSSTFNYCPFCGILLSK